MRLQQSPVEVSRRVWRWSRTIDMPCQTADHVHFTALPGRLAASIAPSSSPSPCATAGVVFHLTHDDTTCGVICRRQTVLNDVVLGSTKVDSRRQKLGDRRCATKLWFVQTTRRRQNDAEVLGSAYHWEINAVQRD